MNIRMKAITAFALMGLAIAGCRSLTPVQNVTAAQFAGEANTALTLEDYEKAIIRAGSERNWRFTPAGPGKLVGKVNVRGKHSATVNITFDTETYSIEYVDSDNLKYDPETNSIHPNYNQWIMLLDNDIQSEIQRLRST